MILHHPGSRVIFLIMKVSILKRPHAGGKIGLYLQFSKPAMMPDGKMARREPLGIFLYDPAQKKLTSEQKTHNRETEQIAETVRAKRQLDVQASSLGVLHESSPMKL
ncbi:MAG: hypothetical protein HGA70_07715, partial [Chlorobiaceae bacterium]|nr:hypothetical protein [Chlorobiaceae bacterium]